MKVRLHPEARIELREARRWYYERSALSATAFAHEVDHAVSRIREAPERYPSSEHGTRKFVLQRFPFNVFYRARENDCDCCRRTSETTSGLLVESNRCGVGMSTLVAEVRGQNLVVAQDSLVVDLSDSRCIKVPLAWYPRLIHGTPDERNN